jgi:hypothetical protein
MADPEAFDERAKAMIRAKRERFCAAAPVFFVQSNDR